MCTGCYICEDYIGNHGSEDDIPDYEDVRDSYKHLHLLARRNLRKYPNDTQVDKIIIKTDCWSKYDQPTAKHSKGLMKLKKNDLKLLHKRKRKELKSMIKDSDR